MNRLAQESSPYLRQHAENPVDWYPWGAEAFEAAHGANKPILLSVGYSSCHWCHVTAHESFEDDAVAKVMNELFVNVKVDREERPDVDAIYMEAVQVMSGQGGWPMTVFLTPDGRPFFAGTYFPKESAYGRPGFVDVLHAIDEAWREQRDAVDNQANQLRDAVAERTAAMASDADIAAHGNDWLSHGLAALEAAYDREWGGFGPAPKFPQASALELLLRLGADEEPYVGIITNTLDTMASGGIYDHLGGGFSRYSVDAFWMVPHFEKMLYDQAALARVYLHAFQVTGFDRYRQVLEETVGYVLRDLGALNGAFFSAEDADSEGEEGRFYVWRPEAIDEVLNNPELSAAVREWYGVTHSGNFEGSNILHRPVRGDLLRSPEVESARRLLFEARNTRVRPGLDDKVLTEWNAMFIATLAEAGAALGRADWLERAERAATALTETLCIDSRWYRAWHESSGPKHLAYANDYAWLVDAFTRLGEATGRAKWREAAVTTADAMLTLFWDKEQGGLFTVGSDAEELVVRSKDLFDGATNSANSTAAVALVRLAALTERDEYRRAAEDIVRLLAGPVANHPTAFTNVLAAVDLLINDATETVIAGDHPELVTAVSTRFLPRNVLLWGERDDSPLWEDRSDGAYICRRQTCGPAAHTAEEVIAQLTGANPL